MKWGNVYIMKQMWYKQNTNSINTSRTIHQKKRLKIISLYLPQHENNWTSDLRTFIFLLHPLLECRPPEYKDSYLIILNVSCHPSLVSRRSAEKSADNLKGIPLYVFNIFSLSFWLQRIMEYSSVGLSCMELHDSWTWLTVSFPRLGNFAAIISSNIFQALSLSPFSFWDPYNANVSALNAVPKASYTVLIS